MLRVHVKVPLEMVPAVRVLVVSKLPIVPELIVINISAGIAGGRVVTVAEVEVAETVPTALYAETA